MKFVALLALLLLASVANAQERSDVHSYAHGRTLAMKDGKHHVVFLGMPARSVGNAVVSHAKHLEGYTGPCIIIANSDKDTTWFVAQLPAQATDADIAVAMQPPGADALDMVNAQRAQRGLRPYLRDPALTQHAYACAKIRAERRIFGHLNGELSGVNASCSGCAGNEPSWGFMACDLYANWTYCGAAYVMGSDGKMYCHAFYR